MFFCFTVILEFVALCHSLHHIFNFSFPHEALSQVSRQNLRGSDCFILGTEDLVIKTSDWVASTADISILGLIKMGLVAEPLSDTVISIGTYSLQPSGPWHPYVIPL